MSAIPASDFQLIIIELIVFVFWFIVDTISTWIDIYYEHFYHGVWHVEKVQMNDIGAVDKITKLLADDYEYVTETDEYQIFRREY